MAKTAQLLIEGVIDPYSYTSSIAGVRDSLSWQGQFDEIEVTINSCGGEISEGLGIYDQLRSYGKPITTIVIGQCCSAATIVFLAGKTRLIYENVVAFMVHQASAEIIGAVTADDARLLADLIDGYNTRMAKIYGETTGKDEETVAGWLSKDTYMTAEEALTNGFATAIAKPVQAKFYARLPKKPETAPNQSSNSNSPIDQMKIISDKAKRLATSVLARLSGTKIEAKEVTTSTGDKLTIDMAGDSFAEGDEVSKDGSPAADGTYTIDGVKITVKDGKIESIDTGDSSTDPTAEDETTVTAEEGTTVTASAEGEDEDPAAELDRLRTENKTLNDRITAMEKNQTTIKAQMSQLSQVLGLKESADPAVPAPKGVKKKVSAKAEPSEEDQDRQDMLDEREAKGLGITVEELRARKQDKE